MEKRFFLTDLINFYKFVVTILLPLASLWANKVNALKLLF